MTENVRTRAAKEANGGNTNTEPEAVAPGFNAGYRKSHYAIAQGLHHEVLLRPVAIASGSVFVDPQCKNFGGVTTKGSDENFVRRD